MYFSTTDILGDQIVSETNSEAVGIHHADVLGVQVDWTNDTPSAKTCVTGTSQVDTLTFQAKASTTHGDYVSITDTSGNKWAAAISKEGIAEVTDITAIGEGAVKEVTQIACIAEGSVKNVTQVTVSADVSGSLAGDYFTVHDASGSVVIWFSVDSVPAVAPATGDREVEIAISEDDTAATVGAAITSAFALDAGLVVGNADEVVTITDVAYGARTAATDGDEPNNTGFAIETTVAGVDSSLDGKYFILQDESGSVGFWFDVDNSGTTIPSEIDTGGENEVDRAVEITSISSEDDLATVGTAVYTAIVADSKFEAGADNLDGSFIVQSTTYGAKTDAVDGDTGFTISVSVQGADDVLDGTYFILQDVDGSVGFWIDVDNSGTTIPSEIDTGGGSEVDRAIEITTVTSGMSASQVAGVVATAINADSKFGAVADGAVITVTNVDKKALTNAADGNTGFTFEVVTQGSDLGAEPTGVIWAAIPSARKVQVDISADTTDENVAARVRTALAGITGINVVITVGSASGATIPLTHIVRASVALPVPKNADDSGAGSIAVADPSTTPGVVTAVNITNNTLTIASHGFATGVKVQLTIGGGSLPAGLVASEDEFIIVVDGNTIKIADTLANAQAGTARDITDYGTAAQTITITPTSIAGGVVHLEASNDKISWYDIASMTANITADGGVMWSVGNAGYMYVRVSATLTAGLVTVSAKIGQKGCR